MESIQPPTEAHLHNLCQYLEQVYDTIKLRDDVAEARKKVVQMLGEKMQKNPLLAGKTICFKSVRKEQTSSGLCMKKGYMSLQIFKYEVDTMTLKAYFTQACPVIYIYLNATILKYFFGSLINFWTTWFCFLNFFFNQLQRQDLVLEYLQSV